MDENSQYQEEQFFSRDKLKKNLKKKSVHGAINKILANGSSIVISMATAVVLARLLSPAEFGLFAMVLTFTEFARLILELGLGVFTVQREKITHEEISTLFWINLAVGIILMAALSGISPVIAWFYGEISLKSICIVLSIVFLIKGSCVQQRALLERQMRFGYLGIINIGSHDIWCIRGDYISSKRKWCLGSCVERNNHRFGLRCRNMDFRQLGSGFTKKECASAFKPTFWA